jgi:hypothetical protein
MCKEKLNILLGRAIAQAVSRWLSGAAAMARARVRSCGICGEQSGTGAGFFQVLRFALPIFIPPIAPISPSSVIWGWYNSPIVAVVPSGLSLTPIIIIIIIIFFLVSSGLGYSSPLIHRMFYSSSPHGSIS